MTITAHRWLKCSPFTSCHCPFQDLPPKVGRQIPSSIWATVAGIVHLLSGEPTGWAEGGRGCRASGGSSHSGQPFLFLYRKISNKVYGMHFIFFYSLIPVARACGSGSAFVFSSWIWIRIQYADPNPGGKNLRRKKQEKCKEIGTGTVIIVILFLKI